MSTTSPHDRPDPHDLLAAVRELLHDDVLQELQGRTRFHVRVAINVLDIIGRELELAPEHATAHRDRLASLGVADDADLAFAIRSGRLDDSYDQVAAAIREAVWDKVAVTNPRYVAPFDSPSTARELS
jgi:hypothetical protein